MESTQNRDKDRPTEKTCKTAVEAFSRGAAIWFLLSFKVYDAYKVAQLILMS